MANGPGFGFSWVKCNMVLSDVFFSISRSSQCSTTGVIKPSKGKLLNVNYLSTMYFSLFLVLASAPRLIKAVVFAILHIKDPLLLIGKSSPFDGSGFPLLLSSVECVDK